MDTATSSIRVLLADDHPLIQEGLVSRLERQEGIEVLGIAASGDELLDMALALKPDIVVTDITMPGMSGLEACKVLHERCPGMKVLMLTMHHNKEYIRRAVACGADGYILKDAPVEQMLFALRQIHVGGSYFDSGVSKALLTEDEQRLTQRETDILLLLIDGMSNREIGKKLKISARTVESHRANIYRKLDTHSLAGLFKYALDQGLVNLR